MAALKSRLVRVDDFVAESLEAKADRMPPSFKAQADTLREAARIYRESGTSKMIRVSEEP